jgi:dipeptidyl aminopeptidase/acylaminoacyl peptidase
MAFRSRRLSDRIPALAASCCALVLAPGLCAAASLTAEDYARAERFLSWNESRYLVNGDVRPQWIGGEDRLWYLRVNAAGRTEKVVVDAAHGSERVEHVEHVEHVELDETPGTGPAADRSIGIHERESAVSPNAQWAVYSKDHNLWVRTADGSREWPLTTDGVEGYDYGSSSGDSTHAITDRRLAHSAPPQVIWSPDSTRILTYRLDEREVKESYLIQSVPEDGSVRPQLHRFGFAFPGDEQIPRAQLLILDVAKARTLQIDAAPLSGQYTSPVARGHVWWSADGTKVYFLDRDRFSKYISLNVVDATTGRSREILRETSSTYVRDNDDMFAMPAVRTLSNSDVIWFSERDGWGHLYYYDGRTGKLRNRITRGTWLVRSIERIDEARRVIYFMGSGREAGRDPYFQHLYRVNFDGRDLRLLTPENAEHRMAASFSPSGRYFVDVYSRPDTPPVFVLRTTDGRPVKTLARANAEKLTAGGYRAIEAFRVLAADGTTPLYGNLFRPSTFDPTRKYPVIDAIYPGPQVSRTRKDFGSAVFDLFEAQTLAELGFVVMTVDGRGTPHRSKPFLDHAYGRLDRASDLDDHIAALRQLASRYPYMDLDRVGIDGVSGGGYAAAHAVLAYPEFYKVAVAAEGNHDARTYLTLWGETFDGPVGDHYDFASNLPLAARLRGKLLLMHGDMDDNVSPSLTLKLVDALVKANKDFDLLILPNGNHNVFTSPYFIRRKWDYFVRNLLGAEPCSGCSIASLH